MTQPRGTLPPDVARGLRAARRRCGMTRAEVAEKVGIGAHYVGRLERGERRPSRAVAQALIHVLRIPYDQATELIRASAVHAGRSRYEAVGG